MRGAPETGPQVTYNEASTKTGWYRTWADKPGDGVYWLGGERMGRVYIHHDKDRWQWFSWVGNKDSGIVGSKERAKEEVELRASLPGSR